MSGLDPSALEAALLPCPFCGGEARCDGARIWCPAKDCWGPIVEHYDAIADAIAAWNRRTLTTHQQVGVKVRGLEAATHRHKKRGTEYVLLYIGKMQSREWFTDCESSYEGKSVDMCEVAIYRSTTDPTEIWVRPREEFEDGRFEVLSALEPAPQAGVPEGWRDLLMVLAPDEPMNQDEQGGCVWCGGPHNGGYAGADLKDHDPDCPWVRARNMLAAIRALSEGTPSQQEGRPE